MRRVIVVAVLVAGCSGPSTPAGYVDQYGGLESQYDTLLESTDCNWLGSVVFEMNERFNRPGESRASQRAALGYQTAATKRMVAIDCP